MTNTKYIVYLGNSGFPYGLAEIQKIILISKSLVLTGNYVTIISRNGVHRRKDHPDLEIAGNYEGIEYVYASGDQFIDERFFRRNLLKVKGLINEFLLLKKRKKNDKLGYAILSTHSFNAIIYYYILSKLFGFKVILNYVEFYSGVKKKWFQVSGWLNDTLFDRYAPSLSDGIFPISEFLISHLKEVSPGKKYLKIPGLTNFEKYDGIEILPEQKYFLFCGTANYREVIEFIIDAFGRLNTAGYFLYLVINGDSNGITEIKKYISNTPQKDKIKIFSRLTERQLYTYYKNAIALLIPLRDTYQDIARFPHKIGEYFASGNPVISTNYGEVKYYFRDMENMLIADGYDLDLFSAKMQFVIDNPAIVEEIGRNGREAAAPIFNYRVKATAIDDFLNLPL